MVIVLMEGGEYGWYQARHVRDIMHCYTAK